MKPVPAISGVNSSTVPTIAYRSSHPHPPRCGVHTRREKPPWNAVRARGSRQAWAEVSGADACPAGLGRLWRSCSSAARRSPGHGREVRLSGNCGEKAARSLESRHSRPVFPLSRYGPAGSSTTAGSADRAVPFDFRRFPAVIHTTATLPFWQVSRARATRTAILAGGLMGRPDESLREGGRFRSIRNRRNSPRCRPSADFTVRQRLRSCLQGSGDHVNVTRNGHALTK